MNKSVQVFLACALGGLIGTLVALNVNHSFWWLGMIVGSIVGYLSYDFKTVLKAVPRAWKATRSWNPDWTELRLCLHGSGFGLGLAHTAAIFWLALTLLDHHRITRTDVIFFGVVVQLAFLLYGTLYAGGLNVCCKESPPLTYGMTNPASLMFWYIPHGIGWTVERIPKGLAFLRRFTVIVLREIHSEIRLLCMTDAAIGVAIGYFAHHALIGALAGGILGVLNFEILSIRVLKVAPRTASLFS